MIVLNDSMVSLCIYSEIVQLCNTSFIDEVAVVPQCSIVTLMCQNEEHRKTLIKKGRKNPMRFYFIAKFFWSTFIIYNHD